MTKTGKTDSEVNKIGSDVNLTQNSEDNVLFADFQISNRSTGIYVQSTSIDLRLPKSITEDMMEMYENAIIHALSQRETGFDPKKHRTFSSKIKPLLELKPILQIVEELDSPVYLMRGDTEERKTNRGRLFVEGLPPDLAWKLQLLLKRWHQQDPNSFPKIKLVLTNLVIIYKHTWFTKLYEFFENHVEFDRIISLKDLLTRDQVKGLNVDKINASFFKGHIKIYVKKEFQPLCDITIGPPKIYAAQTNYDFDILCSDQTILQSISASILPFLHKIFTTVIDRAKSLSLSNNTSKDILSLFTDSFVILPIIDRNDYENLINIATNLMLQSSKKLRSIKSDLDVLHYIISISDGFIPIEQLLTDWTRYDHFLDFNTTKDISKNDDYVRFKKSGKPNLKSRYYLLNPEKFHIRMLDLSNIRLIKQPDMDILSKLEYLKFLKLDNNRSISEFDITKIEFGKLKSIEELSLRNCDIRKLSKSMFNGALNLSKLILEDNPISYIEPGCFSSPRISEIVVNASVERNWPDDIMSVLNNTNNVREAHKKLLLDKILKK
ncbi:MAG: hypothetical protein GPJ54_14980 [Candidatus Heimdallarchaeota archaeon]|nr:hypothetical protein [Candidatus Heimdallarchaeota archaeon]